MQSSSSTDAMDQFVDLGRYPCPPRYRAIFGFSCISLFLAPTGEYHFMDPHRSARIVTVDSDTLAVLSEWRPIEAPLRATGS